MIGMSLPRALGQIAFQVADVPASVSLFRDVLGVPFLFSAGPNLAFLDLWGTRLMVGQVGDGQIAGQNSVLYLTVESVDLAYSSLGDQLAFEGEPHLVAKMPDHELWMVFFRDAENNLLAFMEERR